MAQAQNAQIKDPLFLRDRLQQTLAVEIPDNVISEVKGQSIILSLPGFRDRVQGTFIPGAKSKANAVAIVIDPGGSAAALESEICQATVESRPSRPRARSLSNRSRQASGATAKTPTPSLPRMPLKTPPSSKMQTKPQAASSSSPSTSQTTRPRSGHRHRNPLRQPQRPRCRAIRPRRCRHVGHLRHSRRATCPSPSILKMRQSSSPIRIT